MVGSTSTIEGRLRPRRLCVMRWRRPCQPPGLGFLVGERDAHDGRFRGGRRRDSAAFRLNQPAIARNAKCCGRRRTFLGADTPRGTRIGRTRTGRRDRTCHARRRGAFPAHRSVLAGCSADRWHRSSCRRRTLRYARMGDRRSCLARGTSRRRNRNGARHRPDTDEARSAGRNTKVLRSSPRGRSGGFRKACRRSIAIRRPRRALRRGRAHRCIRRLPGLRRARPPRFRHSLRRHGCRCFRRSLRSVLAIARRACSHLRSALAQHRAPRPALLTACTRRMRPQRSTAIERQCESSPAIVWAGSLPSQGQNSAYSSKRRERGRKAHISPPVPLVQIGALSGIRCRCTVPKRPPPAARESRSDGLRCPRPVRSHIRKASCGGDDC
jgi:hypothetical protein